LFDAISVVKQESRDEMGEKESRVGGGGELEVIIGVESVGELPETGGKSTWIGDLRIVIRSKDVKVRCEEDEYQRRLSGTVSRKTIKNEGLEVNWLEPGEDLDSQPHSGTKDPVKNKIRDARRSALSITLHRDRTDEKQTTTGPLKTHRRMISDDQGTPFKVQSFVAYVRCQAISRSSHRVQYRV
jgi:hypothetical protein